MTTQAASSPPTVAVLVGSVRRPRIGRLVADWFVGRAAERDDLRTDLIDLAEVALPLTDTPPGGNPASPIAGRLAEADGFVVVTPEYNHSFPAALKNAIDWHHREWMGKPVAFVSYGAGSGGVRAVEQLRLVFAELHAATTRTGVVLTAPWERIDAAGRFVDDGPTRRAADATLTELVWWAEALRAARRTRPYGS
ncbi:NADPH-dependent FMN reductase [Micromonospora globbae]|uniref:NAD(P)H-dependent oxidoreductase n=1 Tax=Micromonospora globbae TaxID=1894969 RepID=A0A420EZ92_9ACTN|nr:NAD(P)H-dependent oxidoreductase [Micromonospora globbae]RKF26086.1 NADPH-dependent oxidoreductase [Micromonospora globbae]WTF85724.1 NAD(P)H-dependent oxidoreductase [Micromonospora globbae]